MDGYTIFALIVVGAVVILAISNTERQLHQADNDKQLFTFDKGMLTITKRDPAYRSRFRVTPLTLYNTAHEEEKLVYTGATVGGVTTGGFHKEGGYDYISSSKKTSKYRIVYKQNGEEKVIRTIQLSADLAEEARKSQTVSQYLNSANQLIVEVNVPMSESDSALFRTYAFQPIGNRIVNKYTELGAPTYEKATAILNWISGSNV